MRGRTITIGAALVALGLAGGTLAQQPLPEDPVVSPGAAPANSPMGRFFAGVGRDPDRVAARAAEVDLAAFEFAYDPAVTEKVHALYLESGSEGAAPGRLEAVRRRLEAATPERLQRFVDETAGADGWRATSYVDAAAATLLTCYRILDGVDADGRQARGLRDQLRVLFETPAVGSLPVEDRQYRSELLLLTAIEYVDRMAAAEALPEAGSLRRDAVERVRDDARAMIFGFGFDPAAYRLGERGIEQGPDALAAPAPATERSEEAVPASFAWPFFAEAGGADPATAAVLAAEVAPSAFAFDHDPAVGEEVRAAFAVEVGEDVLDALDPDLLQAVVDDWAGLDGWRATDALDALAMTVLICHEILGEARTTDAQRETVRHQLRALYGVPAFLDLPAAEMQRLGESTLIASALLLGRAGQAATDPASIEATREDARESLVRLGLDPAVYGLGPDGLEIASR